MRKKPSELDFEEYIRQVEPAKREKSYAWSTAIGLQQVDGLTPSDYLEKFFRNLLMGEHNELKNRYLHVDYKKVKDSKNVPVNVPLNVPLKDRQKKVIAALSKDPHASAQKLAEKFGVTEKTIKRDLQLLKQQNLITRVGADKNGYWKVN